MYILIDVSNTSITKFKRYVINKYLPLIDGRKYIGTVPKHFQLVDKPIPPSPVHSAVEALSAPMAPPGSQRPQQGRVEKSASCDTQASSGPRTSGPVHAGPSGISARVCSE